MKIEFFRHGLTEEDIARAADVLRSVFLTTGPMVGHFEEEFAGFLGIGHAVGLTSCTGALHLALLRAGVGPGDEVVTTPMTFVATATAVIECGARPVFADVDPRSGLLTPEAAERALTPRTRALLPVHLYGRMVDMRGFAALAARRGVALIEDAAHCVEGERDGVRPGQLSRAACFSFYATKALTCGEGGALVCNDAADADWYRSARHHGISRNAASRYTGPYCHWDMEMMGWKYNMDDVQAALLVGQIARLERQRARREALEALYRHWLADVPGLDLVEPPGPGERSGHHLFTVLVPRGVERDAVLARLQAAGVGCAVNYRAVHTLTYFRETYGYAPGDFPAANDIGERTISLPLYPALTEEQIERVCAALREAIAAR
ncbi:MAG TPA: DegT/DnrJ/EryC1/StrS family aminotransferase [bacterium]